MHFLSWEPQETAGEGKGAVQREKPRPPAATDSWHKVRGARGLAERKSSGSSSSACPFKFAPDGLRSSRLARLAAR